MYLKICVHRHAHVHRDAQTEYISNVKQITPNSASVARRKGLPKSKYMAQLLVCINSTAVTDTKVKQEVEEREREREREGEIIIETVWKFQQSTIIKVKIPILCVLHKSFN